MTLARAWPLALVPALAAACHGGGARAQAPEGGAPGGRLGRALPDAAGAFRGGALVVDGEHGYVRRRYERGVVWAEVTIADRQQAPVDYEQWLVQSRDYPQAALPLPPDAANGFYTCAGPGTAGACDLHVQMRAGFHVEVMSSGHATRAELDALVARLPFAALLD
jgi:hypothetical protein